MRLSGTFCFGSARPVVRTLSCFGPRQVQQEGLVLDFLLALMLLRLGLRGQEDAVCSHMPAEVVVVTPARAGSFLTLQGCPEPPRPEREPPCLRVHV